MNTNSLTPVQEPASFYDEDQIQSAIRCALREHREPASVLLRGPRRTYNTTITSIACFKLPRSSPPPPPVIRHVSWWKRACACLLH